MGARQLIRPIVIIAALAAPISGAADPVFGLWRTAPDDRGSVGFVRAAPCGAAICGTIVGGKAGKGVELDTSMQGKQVFWNMRPDGAGGYEGGKVWAPDRDLTVNGRLKLSGDRLDVTGCLMGICKSGGVWQRMR